MGRSIPLFLLVVMVVVCAGLGAVPRPAAASPETAGRLGSSREEFELKYGAAADARQLADRADMVIARYDDVSRYGEIEVVYYRGDAVAISLTPAAGETWSIVRGRTIADRFLPRDVVLGNDGEEIGAGQLVFEAESDALVAQFDEETYELLGRDGLPGDCFAVLATEANGEVGSVAVLLGLAHPVDPDDLAGAFGDPVANVEEETTGGAASGQAGRGTSRGVEPVEREDQVEPARTGFSAAEQAYLLNVYAAVEPIPGSMERFSRLFDRAGNDPYLVLDDDWLLDVATEFAIWRLAYDQVLALDPPPVFVHFHNLTVASLDKLVQASYEFAYAIDYFDVAALERGALLLEEAGALMEDAGAEMERINRERGI